MAHCAGNEHPSLPRRRAECPRSSKIPQPFTYLGEQTSSSNCRPCGQAGNPATGETAGCQHQLILLRVCVGRESFLKSLQSNCVPAIEKLTHLLGFVVLPKAH